MTTQTPLTESTDVPIYTDVNKVPLTLLEQLSGHWRVLADQKRRQHDVSARRIILGQLFTLVAVAAVSTIIEPNKESLLLVGGALILYPSLVDLLVSNSAALAASVHHDIDSQQNHKFFYIMAAIFRSIAAATLACGIIGVLAGLLGWWIFSASFIHTMQLALLTGFLSGLIGLPLIVGVTFIARRLKTNPDDVDPPLENTVFSVLVLIVIGVASRILA